MLNEITRAELLNNFELYKYERREVSWAQRFNLTDGNGKTYDGSLRWHEDDGYTVTWYGTIPPEAFRPEFEYILDSIMIGDKNEATVVSNTN